MNIASIGTASVPPATPADAEIAPPGFGTALIAAMTPGALAAPLPVSSGAVAALPSPPGTSAPAREDSAKSEPTALAPEGASLIKPSAPVLLTASGGNPLGDAALAAIAGPAPKAIEAPSSAADAATDDAPVAGDLTESVAVPIPDTPAAVAVSGEPVATPPSEGAAEGVNRPVVAEADFMRSVPPTVDESKSSATVDPTASADALLHATPQATPLASIQSVTTKSRGLTTATPPLADAAPAVADAAPGDMVPVAKAPSSAGTEFSAVLERPAVQATGQSSATAGTPASGEATRPEPTMARGEGLPSSLLSQSLPGSLRPATAASPYPRQDEAVVTARPGAIGREMGVEIVRRLAAGKDEMLIRLNPREMGRIEVRLSFGEGGSLRAVVTADSPAALEMLRRDAGDLSRTLSDAGVRADTDSFRFNSRGNEAGQGWQGRQEGGEGRRQGGARDHGQRSGHAELEQTEPAYRHVRASGQIDLMA